MSINYLSFKEALAPFLCFSVHDARKHFPGFDRKRLTEWQKKGYIQRVVREYYLFKYLQKDTLLWWYVTNCIYEPSYISLQSALNHHGLIPEAVFHVTSVTTKRTRKLDAPEIRFTYRNIKNSCYFGYMLLPFRDGHYIRVAEPEKALLDLLYLETSMDSKDDFEAWRLNKEMILETINKSRMDQYAELMQNRAFYNRFLKLKKWLYA